MAPSAKGKRKQSEESDSLELPVSPKSTGEQSRSQSPVLLEDSPEAGREQEEEQAFLVSLYKFMKERHTPIERVPHLGFKQINLWKIYKAVERLGAYELVTGRRLWKNVYDELGGSPGSTSAATCTRRHYERLVLPYVRHLKGEDDKPLPPSKPRKPYKMAKEHRGSDGATERLKKAKEERQLGQMIPGKTKTDTTDLAQLPSQRSPKDSTKQPDPASGPSSPGVSTSSCSEAYKRFLSNLYKGTYGVMSPLAKKKLLAQVSRAEALLCHENSCHHGVDGPEREPPESPQTLRELAENSGHQQVPESTVKAEVQAGPCPTVPLFTGCFQAYPTEVLKPVGQHPWNFSSWRGRVLMGPSSKKEGLSTPEPRLGWAADASRPSAFQKSSSRKSGFCPQPRACWVSPIAKGPEGLLPPPPPHGGPSLGHKRSLEQDGSAHGGKQLRAASPLLKEETQGCGAKPAAPGWAVSCLLGPALGLAAPESYRGTMLHCPLSFASAPDHLKGQSTLPISPLVIPAFPAHLLAAAGPSPVATSFVPYPLTSFDSALHHRLSPASSAWHTAPVTSCTAPPFFCLNTTL